VENAAVREPATDAELVAALRGEPADGVAALYDRYGRLVYSVALRIVQDHGAAEEVVQDVFVRCWRTIDRYRPEQGSLTAWLLSIAHNRAIDELRSRRGKELRRQQAAEPQEQVVVDPGFEAVLVRGDVRQALGNLPESQRQVIELIFWGGLTRREIAERLRLPLGTVHTRLRLGMDKLRDTLRRLVEAE
jgi:RNA polymerase sigma-70 factor (ECF subfamily)